MNDLDIGKLKQKMNENMNITTGGIKTEIAPKVRDIVKKYFSTSSFYIDSGPLSGEDYWIGVFSLGSKKEWGCTSHNSIVRFQFSIEDLHNGKYIFACDGCSISIAPEKGSYLAFSRVKVPVRKKTGDAKSVLKSVDTLFSRLKKSLKDNVDKLRLEDREKYEKYI